MSKQFQLPVLQIFWIANFFRLTAAARSVGLSLGHNLFNREKCQILRQILEKMLDFAEMSHIVDGTASVLSLSTQYMHWLNAPQSTMWAQITYS